MEFRPKPLGLWNFCLGLLDELRSAMTAHCMTLRWVVELPPSQEHFLLDDALMRNIVENLLSNAIKYSSSGGEVRLSAGFADGVLTITVADQGIGVPLHDQANLFESFHRASNVGAVAGTGLGLTIVREAVQRHGGTISVHSEVGVGSSFTVTLPTKKC
jgi:signal transduction histidine kinase